MENNITGTITVVPFKFGPRDIRTALIADQPWFVAVDVCESLDLVNTARALSRLDDDEKGIHSMNTLGGLQNLSLVNESGLYSLILRSRKPEAKLFKKWVTSEVLPSIRKTGQYELSSQHVPDTHQRVFQGRPVFFAIRYGKPWLSLGNVCSALGIGSTTKVMRNLRPSQMCRVMRGKMSLRMIDATAGLAAAEYCLTGQASEYREWLHDVLEQITEAKSQPDAFRPDEQDLACLKGMCNSIEALTHAHLALLPTLTRASNVQINDVTSALSKLQQAAAQVRQRFELNITGFAQGDRVADKAVTNRLGDSGVGLTSFNGNLFSALDATPEPEYREVEDAARKLIARTRLICSFDPEGKWSMSPIPHNALVIAQDKLAVFIGDPCGAPRETLSDILEAVGRRMRALH